MCPIPSCWRMWERVIFLFCPFSNLKLESTFYFLVVDVDGMWGEWGEWSSCSVQFSCQRGGIRRRFVALETTKKYWIWTMNWSKAERMQQSRPRGGWRAMRGFHHRRIHIRRGLRWRRSRNPWGLRHQSRVLDPWGDLTKGGWAGQQWHLGAWRLVLL